MARKYSSHEILQLKSGLALATWLCGGFFQFFGEIETVEIFGAFRANAVAERRFGVFFC